MNCARRIFRHASRRSMCKRFSTVPNVDIQNPDNGIKIKKPQISQTMADDILKHSDYFDVHNLFTVKEMFDAKVHLGHKLESLEKEMRPYVFGERLGHVIFDLDITAYHLRKAMNFCAHIVYRNGIVLFISHNKRSTLIVENTAKACKEFAYTRNWRDGIFTNSKDIFSFDIRLPDLCIFLNTKYETGQCHGAVNEASKLLIPVIGVVDSNCKPNLITYPIPGNDDSPSSVNFFCQVFKKVILRAKKKREEDQAKQVDDKK